MISFDLGFVWFTLEPFPAKLFAVNERAVPSEFLMSLITIRKIVIGLDRLFGNKLCYSHSERWSNVPPTTLQLLMEVARVLNKRSLWL